MRSNVLLLLLFPLLLVAAGCGPSPRVGDDDDDDSTGGDDDDDDDAVPDEETDCDDGIDEDQDELTDCADPDCADVAPCWWPSAVTHSGDFQFTGFEIQCEVGGFPFDYDVDDCHTAYTSDLATETTDCPVCDRTFSGAFAYSEDGCGDLLETASPASGAFGFIFLSVTEWEIYAIDEATGEWVSVGIAEDDGAGNHIIAGAEVISGSNDDCGWDKDQDLGSLAATLSWAHAAP